MTLQTEMTVLASIESEPRHVGLTVWRFYVPRLGKSIHTSRYEYLRGVRDPAGVLFTHGLSHRWTGLIQL